MLFYYGDGMRGKEYVDAQDLHCATVARKVIDTMNCFDEPNHSRLCLIRFELSKIIDSIKIDVELTEASDNCQGSIIDPPEMPKPPPVLEVLA